VICDQLVRQLADYTDGVLPDAVCEEVQRHLNDCAACQDLADDLAALARLCRGCESPRMPEELRRRLLERLRQA
jgi:hypothetical protein